MENVGTVEFVDDYIIRATPTGRGPVPGRLSTVRADLPPPPDIEQAEPVIDSPMIVVPLHHQEGRNQGWRHDPRTRRWSAVPDGEGGFQHAELFTIGAVARALHKSQGTIRRWIDEGVLPDSGLKTERIKGTLSDAGRRLWTAEQIETLVRIATEEGVIGPGRTRSMGDSPFPGRVRAIWLQNNW